MDLHILQLVDVRQLKSLVLNQCKAMRESNRYLNQTFLHIVVTRTGKKNQKMNNLMNKLCTYYFFHKLMSHKPVNQNPVMQKSAIYNPVHHKSVTHKPVRHQSVAFKPVKPNPVIHKQLIYKPVTPVIFLLKFMYSRYS